MRSNLNQISSPGDFSSPDPKPKIAISYFSTLLRSTFKRERKSIDGGNGRNAEETRSRPLAPPDRGFPPSPINREKVHVPFSLSCFF